MKKIFVLVLVIAILLVSVTAFVDKEESSSSESSQHVCPDEFADYKPVIYLYPEKETDVEVVLDYAGELTCVYPEYNGKWEVTAFPDGTLIGKNGMEGRMPIELNEDEIKALKESAETLKDVLEEIE